MVEAKARRGNDDLDDVFVATSRRTARDRAWGVIFGIGKRARLESSSSKT